MRLISYNILDGGEGRADPLGEVTEAQRADVVCFVEADDLAVVERIANRLKMDFIHAPGNTKASALLSRFPISQTFNHALLRPVISKSLLEASVVDPVSGELPIGVVHLHARAGEEDEQVREREIAEVLRIFAPYRDSGQAHLLAGDFNSNAPCQQIEPERVKPSTREQWDKNGGKLPRRVVQQILDAGYLDSLQVVHPEQARTSGTFSTQFPGQRVDYIFTFGIEQRRLKEAWIECDRLAKYASDHFPIGLQLE